ncbi:MAG: uroporphyrinogen decarboxylase family protein [Clostridia bacterium]|nr:uroporphyrinogen decarboxylase family protein [Clostridia bacterium]
MNMKQWLAEVMASKTKRAMPILSFPSTALLGVSVRELISSAALQAEGMKHVALRTDSLASVSLMDLSVEAEAFGCPIKVSDGEVPTVTDRIVWEEEDADALAIPEVGAGRTGLCIEAIRRACAEITDRPVFAGVIGPYSLAGRLMDVSEIMILCYEEPDMVHTVMEKATTFLIDYMNAYKQTGACGVVVAEPLAGLLSPSLMEEFAAPYMKRIVDAVQTDDFLVIYHNCGNAVETLAEQIVTCGASAYHFGNACDMEKMLVRMPSDTLVMGNIDPVGEFRGGTPESMRTAVLSLLARCSSYPNFVISSGCDIPPSAKWENIDAFFAAVREFYGALDAAVSKQ